jgi:hypothetical protein
LAELTLEMFVCVPLPTADFDDVKTFPCVAYLRSH